MFVCLGLGSCFSLLVASVSCLCLLILWFGDLRSGVLVFVVCVGVIS